MSEFKWHETAYKNLVSEIDKEVASHFLVGNGCTCGWRAKNYRTQSSDGPARDCPHHEATPVRDVAWGQP